MNVTLVLKLSRLQMLHKRKGLCKAKYNLFLGEMFTSLNMHIETFIHTCKIELKLVHKISHMHPCGIYGPLVLQSQWPQQV